MLNPMPSGAKLNYLCKGSNFTIQNWSQKIARKSLNNKGVSKLWASTRHIHAALYVTYRMRRAKINFTMFLTIFEYAESNAEQC